MKCYHSELVMKGVFHVHLQQHSCHYTKKQKSSNQIARSTNNLESHLQKNVRLGARKEKLVHETGHVSWTKNAACKK